MTTPLLTKKSVTAKKDDETDTLTTENYKQRHNLNYNLFTPEKIKSNPSFSLDKISTRALEIAKTNLIPDNKRQPLLKLPSIMRHNSNLEDPEADTT